MNNDDNDKRTPEVSAISAAKTDVVADADADAAAELSNFRLVRSQLIHSKGVSNA